jgi:DNA-binding GntR family transcriptional regulator
METRFLLPLAPRDARRLAPYLPSGLIAADEADGPARAEAEMKRLLLAQRLQPGQKVSLDDIAANLSMSRTPVREALRRLEIQGFVTALPNRGFVIRRIDAAEMTQLFEARRCIEGFAAAGTAARRSRALVNELSHLQATYEQVLKGAPHRRRLGMLADKAFHMRIVEQTGNSFLIGLLSNLFDRLIFTRPLHGFPLTRMDEAIAEHEAILTALERGSPEQARDAILQNIAAGSVSIIEHLKELEASSIAI